MANSSIFAQGKTDKLILKGIDELYNFNFESCTETFQKIIDDDPSNPAGYHYKSVKHLWYFLDDKNENDFEIFLAYSDTAILKAEEIINSDSTNPFIYYILGTSYSYRAVAYGRAEEYLNALWATKKFHSILSAAILIDSTFYDAYLGLGLYNFAVSQTPQAWRWALDLTGISGDKKNGVKYIKLAAEKGKFNRNEAKFYLSQIQAEFFRELKDAEKILTSLSKKYPHNLLFAFTLANLQVKNYKIKSAMSTLQKIAAANDSFFTQLANYSNLSVADILFIENDFDSAKVFYKIFLDGLDDNYFKGIASFRLGLCYQFLELPDSAAYYYSLSSEGNKDLDEDNFANIMGKRFLENPPDSLKLKLFEINNILKSGKFKAVVDSINKLIVYLSSDTLRVEAVLYLCEAHLLLKHYQLAIDLAVSIINADNCELWVKPFACYYAALASTELNKKVDAELFLEYAENYSNYFYENRLQNLLYSLSYKLQQTEL